MARWKTGLFALAWVSACAPIPPQARLSVVSQAAAAPTLTLSLPWRAARSVHYVEGSRRVRITIDAADLATPYERVVTLADQASLVSLVEIPVGARRLVTVQALDAQDAPIPGAVARTAGDLGRGANTLSLSAASTVLGEVVAALLARDRAEQTAVLQQVPLAQLATAIAGYGRARQAPHFALLDAAAIAAAIHAGGGAVPALAEAFVRSPGTLQVSLTGIAPGASYVATVNDPASQPVMIARGASTLTPVAPGDWTLTLTPTAPGLPTRSLPITVAPGATLPIDVALSEAAVGPTLPRRLAAATSAVLPISGVDNLVMLGGLGYSDAVGRQMPTAGCRLPAGGAWQAGPALGIGLVAAAHALHGGKLYWFGGFAASGPTGQGGRFDPAGAGSVSALAALPDGRTLQGASAGTLGETIYVAGGITDQTNTLNEQVLAYAPATNTWSATGLPALAESRVDMGSAVVGDRWFLIGGIGREALSSEGPFRPESAVSIFRASPAPAWEAGAPMPTARSGAGTVVVDGEIWVIGGAGLAGEPVGAVEVYNPTTEQWRIHAPLKQARAFPAVGLLNGQIVVAGGMDGFDPRLGLPLDSVEVLTP